MMAGRVCARILMQCVFIEILLFTSAQREHMINVALNQRCDVSSRYEDMAGDCHAAINGNTSTEFTMGSPLNCIHTSDNDHHPYWHVYLNQIFTVNRIIIYGREHFQYRMDCVHVLLDGREIFTFPCPGTVNVTNIIYLRPPKQVQVVAITRDIASSGEPTPFLNICKVEIWVCMTGWWGSNCQNPCSEACYFTGHITGPGEVEDNYCHSVDYVCPKECAVGHYNVSNDCQNTCGSGCDGGTCNSSDGRCRCQPGWEADRCQRCSDKHWGHNCSPCGAGCLNNCNVNSGICQCKTRWTGSMCTECAVGHYNVSNDCRNTCGLGCVGGCSYRHWGENCSPCGAGCLNICDVNSGTCQCKTRWTGSICTECAVGYYNEYNDCQNTCGSGCDGGTCNKNDGRCRCRPGWEPDFCQRCSDKHWGENCTPCGAGCLNNCNVNSGTCQCKTRWTGSMCTECSDGHYNMSNDCQNTCGRGCHDTCSRTNGTCQCRTGWQPPLCQHCSEDFYNESNDCQNICGKGCQDTCSRTDGTCQCRPGWQPPLCQEKFYNAPNDRVTCGRGCHDICNITDGTCQCRPGWQPPLCQDCADHYYNKSNDCVTCGEGCHDTCNKTDGTCQCRPDWQPPLCQDMTSSNDDNEAPSGSGPVAGIAVGCVIVFLILGVLTILYLRRSRSHQTSGTRGSLNNTYLTATSSTHPAEQPATTSSEDTANNSINVYDELNSRNEDNTAAYTSLNFQNKNKESAVPSDYINTRKDASEFSANE